MAGRADPLLSCSGVDVQFGTQQVLFGVDLTVQRGEVVALVGTNGSGKSTLLNAISQLVMPSSGRIELDGSDITRVGAREASRRGVSMMPGGRGVFPTLTVAEHFTASSWTCGDRTAIEDRIDTVLDMIPRARTWWQRRVGELSRGEQQQVALATALMPDPTLLLVDELSLGLAPAVVAELLDLIHAINRSGCTVIVVEQSLEVARWVATRAYFLEQGVVRFSGPIADLEDRRDLLRPVHLPVERRARAARPAVAVGAATAVGAPALSVRGLTKRFGGVEAVADVSLDLAQGTIVGIIGPNGAGKTTLVDLVAGVLRPDTGAVRLLGEDVGGLGVHQRALRGIGRSSRDGWLFPSLTVAETIALAFECRLEVRDHLASTLRLAVARSMERDLARDTDELVVLLGLQHLRDAQVETLSTGARRVVELAMAMAQRPRVLLLDEPSSGLAKAEIEALPSLLDRLRRDHGCAMVVIDHDIELVRSVADELIVLAAGRVIAHGPPAVVVEDAAVVSAFFGADAPTRGRRHRRHALRAEGR